MPPPPPFTTALLAFAADASVAQPAGPAYPGVPPPPPPPRRLAALARVGSGGGGGRGGGGVAATPAALWAARAAAAAPSSSSSSPSSVILVAQEGADAEAARQWASLAACATPSLAVTGVVGGPSLVGAAARAAAAAAAGAPTDVLLIEADAIPMPWVDLARLVAAARVLGGCAALPVAGTRPPAALATAAGVLAAGGGWWREAGDACPPLTAAETASSRALALPLLYLPAAQVGAFAAAADAVGAASLCEALAGWVGSGGQPCAALPFPAPLPSAATLAGRALAAALLAKPGPPGVGSDVAAALDGRLPAAVAFAEALLAQAGVVPAAVVEEEEAEEVETPPTTTTSPTRYCPPPRRANPAYTTTNAAYGARPPAPHEVATPVPAVAAVAAARAALPPLHPPVPGKERGMRLAGAAAWLASSS